MLRDDERTAWNAFLAAEPQFAGEELASQGDGPDPPDVLCVGKSGKKIGVELTKWVEHEQMTDGSGRKLLEDSYLAVIRSEKEPKPDRIGRVVLYDKSKRLKPEDQAQFRRELFALVAKEAPAGPTGSPAKATCSPRIMEHSSRWSRRRFHRFPNSREVSRRDMDLPAREV